MGLELQLEKDSHLQITRTQRLFLMSQDQEPITLIQ